MRHARLAALTVAAMLIVAACSGSSSSTPPAAASVAASTPTVAPSLAPSVAPSTAVSIAPSVAPSAAEATGDAVSIANFSFKPAAITVPVGATVTWTNNDSAGHTVTADDGSFKSDRLGSGATFSQSFAQAGTFAYHCAIHPGMTGTVTVH